MVQYDALGRATEKVEQAQVQVAEPTVAQTTTFQYDADGRATQTSDASGTTSTSYDAVGRVIGVLHPGSTQPDSTTYDLGTRVTTTTNSTGTTKTYYDALWRVVKEEHDDTNGTLISTTSHAYDANGNELNPVTTLANGTQSGVTYTYDPLGRIATVSDSARTYTYDANGRVGTMTAYSDPGKTTTAYQAVFGYDAGTRTSTLTDKVGPSGVTLHSYSYDTANNRTAVTEDGTTTKYLYDNLNELTKVTDATGATTLASYTYDANHNRATMVTSAGTTQYTYDAAGSVSGDVELKQKTDPDGTLTTYSYDTAGDLTQAVSNQAGVSQTTTYIYDVAAQGCAKRLCEVDRPDGTHISFSYDADGNRLSKTVTTGGPVPTTTVIHDVYQAGRIAYQTDGAGNTLATFSYDAGGTPSSVQVGADPATAPRYYYVYNAHGDVVALTDAAGTVVASYSYDAFGSLTSSSESFPGGWSNPYRYDGTDRVRYDTETGLYWMSVRAYDPTLGRFLARDPLNRQAQVTTNQPYVYGANNPLANVDPSGQFIWSSGMTASQQDYAAALIASRMNPHLGKPAVPPVNCREENSDKCGSWSMWKQNSEIQRLKADAPALVVGALTVAAGGFLRLVAKAEGFQVTGDVWKILQTIAEFLSIFANEIIAPVAFSVGIIGGVLGWGQTSGLGAVASMANTAYSALMAVYEWANAFAKAGGMVWNFLKGVFFTGVALGIQALKGEAGVAWTAAKALAGDAVDNLAYAIIDTVQAAGWAVLTGASLDMARPIWDWCSDNGGQCGAEPQYTFAS